MIEFELSKVSVLLICCTDNYLFISMVFTWNSILPMNKWAVSGLESEHVSFPSEETNIDCFAMNWKPSMSWKREAVSLIDMFNMNMTSVFVVVSNQSQASSTQMAWIPAVNKLPTKLVLVISLVMSQGLMKIAFLLPNDNDGPLIFLPMSFVFISGCDRFVPILSWWLLFSIDLLV